MKDKYPFFDLRYVMGVEDQDMKRQILKQTCEQIVSCNNLRWEDTPTLGCKGIVLSISDWCNNTGDGKYIHKSLWKNYLWIYGKALKTAAISKNYAIRFSKSQYTKKEVQRIALKLLKRHAKRYLNEMEYF